MRPWLALACAATFAGCLALDPLDGAYAVAPVEALSCEEQSAGVCQAVWSESYGGEGAVEVAGIAARGNGSVYVAGTFSGILSLGTTSLSADDADVFVLRTDNDGGSQFATPWTRAGFERSTAIAVAGNSLAVAGNYGSGFEGCTQGEAGEVGVFVSLADADTLVRGETYCFAGGGEPIVTAAVFDGDSVWVAGTFDGELTVDAVSLVPDERDGFVLTIDPDGTEPVRTPAHITGPGEQTVPSMVALVGGGVAIVGESDDSFSVAPLQVDATEEADAYFAEIGPDGRAKRLRSWGGAGDQALNAIAIDADGIYLAGELDEGELSFGSHVITAPGGDLVGAFVAAFDNDEDDFDTPSWVATFHAEDLDVSALVASESALFVGGTVDGTIVFDQGVANPGGCVDIFVTRFDKNSGLVAATERCGDRAEQRLHGLAIHAGDDEPFLAASYEGLVDLEASHEASAGTTDLLVAQIRSP